VARALIVGCGCRGQSLARALAADGIAVRGTTRRAEATAAIEAAGAEAAVADPDRLATLVPQLAGVTVVCWLLGTAHHPSLHGERLQTMLEHIVDTPVRGLVYEGTAGGDVVRAAGERWRMPVRVVSEPPEAHEPWLAAMREAVAAVLA
jgi:nucleoside-diphosphate-sugar epimerase